MFSGNIYYGQTPARKLPRKLKKKLKNQARQFKVLLRDRVSKTLKEHVWTPSRVTAQDVTHGLTEILHDLVLPNKPKTNVEVSQDPEDNTCYRFSCSMPMVVQEVRTTFTITKPDDMSDVDWQKYSDELSQSVVELNNELADSKDTDIES